MRIFLLALVAGAVLLLLAPPAAYADVQFGPLNFPGKKRCVGMYRPVYAPACPNGTDFRCGPPVYKARCPDIRLPRFRFWRSKYKARRDCQWLARPYYVHCLEDRVIKWPRGYHASTNYPGGPVDFGGRNVVRPRRGPCR